MNDSSTSAHQNKSQALTQNSLLIIARYRLFHEKAKKSAAVEKFCAHGGRYIFWLPYRCEVWITIFISCNVNTSRGWDDISGTVNVTYFGDESPFTLEEVSFTQIKKIWCFWRYWWKHMQMNNSGLPGVEEEQPKKHPEAVLCHHQTLCVSCKVNKTMIYWL